METWTPRPIVRGMRLRKPCPCHRHKSKPSPHPPKTPSQLPYALSHSDQTKPGAQKWGPSSVLHLHSPLGQQRSPPAS